MEVVVAQEENFSIKGVNAGGAIATGRLGVI